MMNITFSIQQNEEGKTLIFCCSCKHKILHTIYNKCYDYHFIIILFLWNENCKQTQNKRKSQTRRKFSILISWKWMENFLLNELHKNKFWTFVLMCKTKILLIFYHVEKYIKHKVSFTNLNFAKQHWEKSTTWIELKWKLLKRWWKNVK